MYNNQSLQETIIISEAITQTLNNINEKLSKGEDISELTLTLTNLTSRLNKKAERLKEKHSIVKEEVKVSKVDNNDIPKTDTIEQTIINRIPKKYHDYISEVSFAGYYFLKLKKGYVAKNTHVVGDAFVNMLADTNLNKIINNLKTIKSVNEL